MRRWFFLMVMMVEQPQNVAERMDVGMVPNEVSDRMKMWMVMEEVIKCSQKSGCDS